VHALRGAGGPGRPRLLAQGLRLAPVQLVQQALLALAQLRDRRLPACQLLLASMRDISAPRPSNVSPPASRMRSRSIRKLLAAALRCVRFHKNTRTFDVCAPVISAVQDRSEP